MKRLTLPFTMGTFGPMDPFTFEREIDHPVLNVGSSASGLRVEVQEWLDATIKDDEWKFGFDGDDYFIDFASQIHYNWFLLRWL